MSRSAPLRRISVAMVWTGIRVKSPVGLKFTKSDVALVIVHECSRCHLQMRHKYVLHDLLALSMRFMGG